MSVDSGRSDPPPEHGTGAPPLSFAQERLWFLEHLTPGSSAYSVNASLRLLGVLDAAAMQAAITAVVTRHQVLRSRFPSDLGTPRQLVVPAAEILLHRIELSSEDALEDRRSEALRLASETVHTPFDLGAAPALRARLIRVDAEEHVLAIAVHHIAFDGWSIRVFYQDLAAAYAAARTGRPASLPPLPTKYQDFAARQRTEFTGDRLARRLDTWRERIGDAPTLVEPPTDRPRRGDRGYAGAARTTRLPDALWARVTAVARARRVTPYMLLLAVYGTFLSRVTGARDLLVGTPVAGRVDTQLESLIGLFANTVPVRIDLRGEPTIADLLVRVRRATLSALSDQDMPFEKLVDEFQPVRGTRNDPLVQTAFSLEALSIVPPELPGLVATRIHFPCTTTKFELGLGVLPGPGGADLEWEYSTELFDAETIDGFSDCFLHLLDQFLGSADTPVRRLEAMSEPRVAELLRTLCAAGPVDEATTVPDLVAATATAWPDRPALVGPGLCLSYAELMSHAGDLAGRLRALGTGPDRVVGVLLPRGPQVPIALLGVLASGGAYLPLDHQIPDERLAMLSAEVGAAVVVTTPGLAERVAAAGAEPVPMAESPEAQSPRAQAPTGARAPHDRTAPQRSERHPDDLAYTIFTSGSTGRPKPVGVTHRGLVAHARAVVERFELVRQDRVLQFANTAFDVAAEELYPTWTAGAAVVVLPDPTLTPEELELFLTDEAITVANIPTPYWQQWVRSLAARNRPLPKTLRLVVIGSDVAHTGAARTWYELTGVRLLNGYGLTETTITSTVHTAGPTDLDHSDVLPIGRPLPGTRSYVLDDTLRLVPPGVPGELYLAGPGLARGYLGDPKRTSERFLPDPYAELPGQRMFRTGDLVRHRADGTLDFLGRSDAQVKIRGHRVEPRETEEVLRGHPRVADALVHARSHDGHTELVAHVVLHPAAPGESDAIGAAQLHAYLAHRLPTYLLPRAIGVPDRFPLTPNGKIDHRALPVPDGRADARSADPATPVERLIASVWAEVLGADRIGVSDNFFALGGDSIRSIQIVGRLRHAGLDLSTRDVFSHETIAALATLLATRERTTAGAGSNPPIPLTPVQHELLHATEFGPPARIRVLPLEGRAPLERPLLIAALDHLLETEEVLRLRPTPDRTGWLTVAGPASGGPSGADLLGHSPFAPAEFDRAKGPLHVLLADGDGERSASSPAQCLVLTTDPLLLDHAGADLLARRLLHTYRELAAGGTPQAGSDTGFRDWATQVSRDTRHAQGTRVTQTSGRRGAPAIGAGEVARFEIAWTGGLARLCEVYRLTALELVLIAAADAAPGTGPVRFDVGHSARQWRGGPGVRGLGQYATTAVVRLPRDADPAVRARILAARRHFGPDGANGCAETSGEPPAARLCWYDDGTGTAGEPVDRPDPFGRHSLDRPRLDVSRVKDRLTLTVTGPGAAGWRTRLTRSFATLSAHGEDPDAGGCVPGDFPLVTITQHELDELVGTGAWVEDILPLGPLQSWMLDRMTHAPRPGLYVVHEAFDLDAADVDPESVVAAWQHVVAANPSLRTSFVPRDGGREPLQIVHRSAPAPVHRRDWRDLDHAGRDRALADHLERLRIRGIDPARAPQLELLIAHCGDRSYRLLWAFDYIVLDGWTFPLLLDHVFACHDAIRAGQPLPAVDRPPLRDFLAWNAAQDDVAAESFWRCRLKGFATPTPLLAAVGGGTDSDAHVDVRAWLPVDRSNALRSLARRNRLTLHTLVQGAYALLLAARTGSTDVLFGEVVSGRPETLPGADRIAGCLNNIIPCRVEVDSSAQLIDWLHHLQGEHVTARGFEHVSPLSVRAWSECPPDQALYQSHLVFENFPFDSGLQQRIQGWRPIGNGAQSDDPLRVTVWPDPALLLKMSYYRRHFGDAEINAFLGEFVAVLAILSEGLDGTVSNTLRLIGATV